LGNLAYIDSELNVVRVKCVHANPERTIAKLKQENNIILPIISIKMEYVFTPFITNVVLLFLVS
jgi:hypothetical protein